MNSGWLWSRQSARAPQGFEWRDCRHDIGPLSSCPGQWIDKLESRMLHVWNMYIHLGHFQRICRQIFHTWSIWECFLKFLRTMCLNIQTWLGGDDLWIRCAAAETRRKYSGPNPIRHGFVQWRWNYMKCGCIDDHGSWSILWNMNMHINMIIYKCD